MKCQGNEEGSEAQGMAIFEFVLASSVSSPAPLALPPPPLPLASDPAGSHTGKEDRMPGIDFYCFQFIGAPKLLFSV